MEGQCVTGRRVKEAGGGSGQREPVSSVVRRGWHANEQTPAKGAQSAKRQLDRCLVVCGLVSHEEGEKLCARE